LWNLIIFCFEIVAQRACSVEMLKKLNLSHVLKVTKAIELLKVVVPGLQCWRSTTMNIPDTISITSHTHFRGNKR